MNGHACLHGLGWDDMARHGYVWCGMPWCSLGGTVTSWPCIVRAGELWPSMAWFDTAWFSMAGVSVPWLCKGGGMPWLGMGPPCSTAWAGPPWLGMARPRIPWFCVVTAGSTWLRRVPWYAVVCAGMPWLVARRLFLLACSSAAGLCHRYDGCSDEEGCINHSRDSGWLAVIHRGSMNNDRQSVWGCNDDCVEHATGASHGYSMSVVGCSDGVVLG